MLKDLEGIDFHRNLGCFMSIERKSFFLVQDLLLFPDTQGEATLLRFKILEGDFLKKIWEMSGVSIILRLFLTGFLHLVAK